VRGLSNALIGYNPIMSLELVLRVPRRSSSIYSCSISITDSPVAIATPLGDELG
jgi:hypothetical protein